MNKFLGLFSVLLGAVCFFASSGCSNEPPFDPVAYKQQAVKNHKPSCTVTLDGDMEVTTGTLDDYFGSEVDHDGTKLHFESSVKEFHARVTVEIKNHGTVTDPSEIKCVCKGDATIVIDGIRGGKTVIKVTGGAEVFIDNPEYYSSPGRLIEVKGKGQVSIEGPGNISIYDQIRADLKKQGSSDPWMGESLHVHGDAVVTADGFSDIYANGRSKVTARHCTKHAYAFDDAVIDVLESYSCTVRWAGNGKVTLDGK